MRDVMNTKTRPGASDETAARLGAGRQPLVRASRLGGRRRVGSSQSARHQHRPHDRRHDARRHAAPGRLQDAGRRGGSSGSERCKRPRHLGTERGRRSKAKLTLTSCLEGGCGCDSCARSAKPPRSRSSLRRSCSSKRRSQHGSQSPAARRPRAAEARLRRQPVCQPYRNGRSRKAVEELQLYFMCVRALSSRVVTMIWQ